MRELRGRGAGVLVNGQGKLSMVKLYAETGAVTLVALFMAVQAAVGSLIYFQITPTPTYSVNQCYYKCVTFTNGVFSVWFIM